jgi:FRG domain
MQSIKGQLPPNLKKNYESKNIARSSPLAVATFPELVGQVAGLAYYNKSQLLFFRGQTGDYVNRNDSSTFLPSIYRGDYVSRAELDFRFDILEEACNQLVKKFEEEKIIGYTEFKRKKLLQWSIIQHYEVCATPLLDFTHSLRVACSFALLNNNEENGYISVFGLPYLTNRISSNSEEDIINIRLLSITPPDALRPYYQEGYLAGTADITNEYESKHELDFNNRLIMKYQIPNSSAFWGDDFDVIPESALYPLNDKIQEICNSVQLGVTNYLKSSDIGDFLKIYNEIETLVRRIADLKKRPYSFREALKEIDKGQLLDGEMIRVLDYLRRFRNDLVHNMQEVNSSAIQDYMGTLLKVKDALLNMDRKR